MDMLYTIAITLATLAVLVAVHEYGHFWVARKCGVKVLRFSIGFGKSLASWKDQQGTEYSVAAIPLGGYVKMLDEREGEVPEELLQQAFNRKPVLQRIAVVAAGPLANLILAVLAYWFLFMAGESGYAPVIGFCPPGDLFALLDRIGDTGSIHFSVQYPGSEMVYESEAVIERWLSDHEQPDLFGGLGLAMYRPAVPPVIEEVVADSPASRAGLQSGDRILSADSEAMNSWMDWVEHVRARPGQLVTLEFEREGQLMRADITPEPVRGEGGEEFGRVGVSVVPPAMPEELIRKFDRGPVEAAGAALVRTWDLIGFTVNSIKKMVMGLISPKNLSGPITIAKVASASAKSGLESYIGFLALLSVSLGVLNLLPIPVLDGGHLLFYTIELLAGRPVPGKIPAFGYQLGLFLGLGMMMLALYNDFTRL